MKKPRAAESLRGVDLPAAVKGAGRRGPPTPYSAYWFSTPMAMMAACS